MQKIYKLVYRNIKEIGDIRIFGSGIIDKIKSKETLTLYKKSCLVIQVFNNQNKKIILT